MCSGLHNIFAVRFRLQYLQELDGKATRSLVLIDETFTGTGLKADTRFLWVYTASFIHCVLNKWRKVTKEDYHSVEYLHQECLMKTLTDNIQTGRVAISLLADKQSALEEWDSIWSGFDD
jgi:hypothetical protein